MPRDASMRRIITFTLAAALAAGVAAIAPAQDAPPAPTAPAAPPSAQSPTGQQTAADWPQTLEGNGLRFEVFEPLFTSMAGTEVGLTVGIRLSGGSAPQQIGIATLGAQAVPADLPGELEVNAFQVLTLQFGGRDAPQAQIDALQAAIGAKAISITRTALMQDMTLQNARASGVSDLGSFVPAIVVTQEPTVLLTIDGDPVFVDIGDTGWRRIVNTPFILLQAQDGSFNARLGESTWVSSMDMQGRYATAAPPPPAVIAALGQTPPLPRNARVSAQSTLTGATAPGAGAGASSSASSGATAATPPVPPRLLVVTQPTVLVSTKGPPAMKSVMPGLSTATNTGSVLLRTDEGPVWWTLASGRWFRAADLAGPWGFVGPDQVPALFIGLPGDRKHRAAKASVPGTPEAVAAIAAAQEMRTVTIDRSAAQCSVTYRGTPLWAGVDGTLLQYCQNSSQPVVLCERVYYCCDNAVWFTAQDPAGPWTLCDSVPDAIYQISSYSPVSAVTSVEVVGSTADSVTYGFDAGYLGTFVTGGTVVYGNGYQQDGVQLADGGYQPVPQTFAAANCFDADTGTFAPPTESDWGGYAPAVQPCSLADGYIGWGWCPGWTTAWGMGWEHPGWWGNWGSWWNEWNPYWNHWWDQQHVWAQERQAQRDARLAQRQAEREDAAAQRERQAEISDQEAQWRARQAEAARAAADRDAQARAEEARYRDQRSYEQAMAERQQRAQYAAQHSGPTAQPGTMLWWYEYYNDYSHGYLSRAGVFHDPRYGPGGPPR